MTDNPGFGNSENDPVHPGQMIKTKIERGDRYSAPEVYDMQLTVLDFVRGVKALELLKSQNINPDPPKPGFEYMLVNLKIGYFQKGRGFIAEPYTLTSGQLLAVSADGKTEFELPSVNLQPLPSLTDKKFAAGETHEGWILTQVPENESRPLLIFKRQDVGNIYGIWGSIWFQLYK
jgi:hypothetical protein